jgi:lipoprotein-anchoring transpeptidase ErfK/SrfK
LDDDARPRPTRRLTPAGRRSAFSLVAVVAIVVALAGLGYLVVHVRTAGGGTLEPLSDVTMSPTPSGSPSASPRPAEARHWIVAKATGPVVARTRPSASAPMRATFGPRTTYGFPTLFLVHETREVAGRLWYRVWLPVPPNGSRGWIAEGRLATYSTTAKIVIDLSRRRLTVIRRDRQVAEFPVAIGTRQYPTPTGFFFVTEKLRPPAPGGAYGVLALSLSAFQPKLSWWAGGGQVAIHGTNQDELIGRAVSHGCVRMHDADILKVSELVPAGSPVVIQR